jgi:antitoxin (DNA-binding transcriptional repressor) of toxin-antitoxin stability system
MKSVGMANLNCRLNAIVMGLTEPIAVTRHGRAVAVLAPVGLGHEAVMNDEQTLDQILEIVDEIWDVCQQVNDVRGADAIAVLKETIIERCVRAGGVGDGGENSLRETPARTTLSV